MPSEPATVSIIIPVHNKLAFTRQCLDRIDRFRAAARFEVIVVDNGSTDGTQQFFESAVAWRTSHRYVRNDANLGFARANNIGARLSTAKYLLFLNNDTLVRDGWLDAMVGVAENDARVGIVGIQQRFPYTNLIHHTGIIFAADGTPQHIYPHADASLAHVNKQRAYQAVTGACLLIERQLFVECGMFDEGYVNGYEDIDLCLTVRERQRSIICCTATFIYHYGQITDTRTADDPQNAARFKAKWGGRIVSDELAYFNADRSELADASARRPSRTKARADAELIYFADDLSTKSALTWATADLVLALHRLGAHVAVKRSQLPSDTDRNRRRALEALMVAEQPVGGTQIRWSHYWPQHLERQLNGVLNFELFVINYLFSRPGSEPWDYWLQTLPFNGMRKLPLSGFCRDVLAQVGVPAEDCGIVQPGFSPEALTADAPARADRRVRLLTVTNSHDLERYGTELVIDAYWRAFSAADDVVLVVKDYGAASGNNLLARKLRDGKGRAAIELQSDFLTKADLIRLYKSSDAFVSAHRGEGFGMKILDAAACGVPIITTLFGGPVDFCHVGNCLPIDFELVPLGACYDTRALRIANGPVWAEPDPESLGRRLKEVVNDPAGARTLAERAQREVVGRFTWENAARQLLDTIASTERPKRLLPVPAPDATERSPYWMGLRVSVVIPTHNRQATLRRCLQALESQSLLPQEFEVVIVDDGSTDGTREMLEAERFPFSVNYIRQPAQGPGVARNAGIRAARGEFVLIIGDDIIAHPHLLEQHLIAHGEAPAEGTAILGHIDWPPELARSRVMEFVCGESSLQFAYAHIPKLPTLDYRFFYTSNISLHRSFLVDAANDGVCFDPSFRYAAFEDSEFAFRLQARGLDIRYRANAIAYHDHWMDLEGFMRREYQAGMMSVVFYRKHPQLDSQLAVRWIGEWTAAVCTLFERPELAARVAGLDQQTDNLLSSAACTIESLSALQDGQIGRSLQFGDQSLKSMSDSLMATIFDVARTRGKVEEWYASVADRQVVETAKHLLGIVRKMDFLAATPAEIRKLRGTIAWLDQEVVADLKRQIDQLTHQVGGRRHAPQTVRLRRAVVRSLRKADLLVQHTLSRSERLLTRYQHARSRLAVFLRGTGVIGSTPQRQ